MAEILTAEQRLLVRARLVATLEQDPANGACGIPTNLTKPVARDGLIALENWFDSQIGSLIDYLQANAPEFFEASTNPERLLIFVKMLEVYRESNFPLSSVE